GAAPGVRSGSGMPDRYEPRNPLRSHGDRRARDARRASATEEDPLAELAKIVQGRTGSAGASPGRGRGEQPQPATSAGSTDLETELLNDLQAPLAVIRDGLGPPPPAPPQKAAPPVESEAVPAPPRPSVREAPAAYAPPRPSTANESSAPHSAGPSAQPDATAPEPHGASTMRSDLPPPRLVPIPEAPVIQPPVVSRTTAPAEERTARLQRAAAAPPPATPAESKESKPVLGNVEMRPTL